MKKATQDQEILLSYSLFDLPTAQHKAGLAGLLFLIDSMKQRDISPLPTVAELTSTSVKFTLGRRSLQAVFDDLYDAEFTEAQVKTKWKGRSPKREGFEIVTDPKTEAAKQVKAFTYDVVVPKASFLRHHYLGDESGWLKLWRDMLWTTLRGRPTTRFVYEERAEKKPSAVAPVVWKALAKNATGSKEGKLVCGEVPGSLFIGAQARSAERVPFNGRVDQNLLLHFWPLTSLVFVPEVIDREGNGNFKGFVISVPEVSDLEDFLVTLPRLLSTMDPQLRGYRPRASIIDRQHMAKTTSALFAPIAQPAADVPESAWVSVPA
jgi:CRISPR-associated protein Cmx8